LLSVTVFAQVGPSQSGQGSDDAMMRQLVQYFMRVGTEQYERGYYIEAEKTFQMAQGYGEFLEPLERRKLESMLEKSGLAAIERKHALAAKQTGEELLGSGQLGAARRACRRQEQRVPDRQGALGSWLGSTSDRNGVLRRWAPLRADGAPANPTVGQASDNQTGGTLDRSKSQIAELYYQSVKAYHTGDFETARAGFAQVLDSGMMPAPMVQTIQGYLQDMDGASQGAGAGQPIALSGSSSVALTSSDLAVMPTVYPAAGAAAGRLPQSDRQRIEQLYNRSWEMYSEGELEAAREGFVEVAESGLFTAPEGRRPEDYIATIDRLLAVSQSPAYSSQRQAAAPSNAAGTADAQGGFIEVINRRRNIIRSHMQAVVSDAADRAQTFMAQGEFEKAREPIDEAQRLVNQNQLHLGDELYRQHSGRLSGVLEAIGQAEVARDQQLAEQKRMEAVEAQQRLRREAETDRQQKIDELLSRTKAYWKQQRYEAALGQIESLLAIDPLHDDALTLKQQLEDMIYMRKQISLDKEYNRQRAQIFMNTAEAGIPYADEVTYPKNWREISARRKPDEPIGLDPESMRVYQQLETIVDLSALSPEMPLSQAIEIIRASVQPPLSIVVLWRDLYENAEVEPSTNIDMEGLRNVKLSIALENLTRAVTPVTAFSPVSYVVNKGVVTIGTQQSLPTQKMETRVYDITDLVGEPANYGGMQGLMTGMMMGMMGTMMSMPQGGGSGDQGGGGGMGGGV
jgi:tetratricopeptide (TPR) repeat protein